MCWGVVYVFICFSLYVYMDQLQPFEGGHDAEVAHGENEFDTPALCHMGRA